MPRCFMQIRTIIFLILLLLTPLIAMGQNLLPTTQGQECLYNVQMDMKRGSMTGLCMVVCDSTGVHASVVNEFGVGLMSFSYDAEKDKVLLHSVFSKMNKWYIRCTLRRDLRKLIHGMKTGKASYRNSRRNITYTFTPINNQ